LAAAAPAAPARPAAAVIAPGIPSSPANWAQTLERIATGVVTIQIDSTRAFDTEWNSTAQATGFVIDAKRGLILTNRHVVTPGPVIAQAIFLNREEVQLYPVYRDPIHDFGIYRYDPAKLKFIQPAELPLYPQGAVIGREIRVVGNDAGEQLSILAGTLGAPGPRGAGIRLRQVQRLQHVLLSGGIRHLRRFLRLARHRHRRARGGAERRRRNRRRVELLSAADGRDPRAQVHRCGQAGAARHVGNRLQIHPIRRIAAPRLESRHRDQDAQRQSQAHRHAGGGRCAAGLGRRRPTGAGRYSGQHRRQAVPEFFTLEDVLDSHVGQRVKIEVQRGKETVQHDLDVLSLDAITADEYIEFGEAVVHTLSYQQARHFNVPIKGVYVANPGYVFGAAGIPRAALISSFNGKKVENLADFAGALAELADGAKAAVRYVTLEDPRAVQLKVIRMDRRWFPARQCKRDDTLGTWPCVSISPGPAPTVPGAGLDPIHQNRRSAHRSIGALAGHGEFRHAVFDLGRHREELSRHRRDHRRAARPGGRRPQHGAGGHGRCARHVRRHGRGAGQGRVHPSAAQSGGDLLRSELDRQHAGAQREPPTKPLKPGDDVWVVGQRGDSKLLSQRTQVSSIDVVSFPLSRTLRFRDSNLEAVSLINAPTDYDGVLSDEKGNVVATWSSFAFESQRDLEQINRGIPADLLSEMIGVVADGRPLYSFEAEFDVQSLAGARELGLPDSWVRRFEEHNAERRQVLGIDRLVAGSPAATLLEPGDLLLAIDGKVVNRFREVERAVQSPEVTVTVWRNGAEKTCSSRPSPWKGATSTGW
jgi:S1-C subfamily serine protease